MSFDLPSVKVRPEMTDSFGLKEGAFGVPNPLTHGSSLNRDKLGASHPLEFSEKNFVTNQQKIGLSTLRSFQGLHAPLKIAMEMKAVKKVGRLPFLESSNALLESLTGDDLHIGFEDILNIPEFREQMVQPHAVIEKSLGIL